MTETATDEATYSAVDVLRLTRITYRQLDYWTRHGFLDGGTDATPGSGRNRHYTARQLHTAALVAHILAVGGTHSLAWRIVALLRDWPDWSGLTVQVTAEWALVTPEPVHVSDGAAFVVHLDPIIDSIHQQETAA